MVVKNFKDSVEALDCSGVPIQQLPYQGDIYGGGLPEKKSKPVKVTASLGYRPSRLLPEYHGPQKRESFHEDLCDQYDRMISLDRIFQPK